ncbi:efflux RND transporter periplasmic adaptor subunit [Actinoplanes sp. NPDC049316]|uniref:efflux RND transporter periplasmic adaptor subunit n=1 Tax=Actinoplanes sp. NPDC049316 TaxID=3154727 RepID=UPI003424C3BE
MSSEAPTERISLPPAAYDDAAARPRRRRWLAAAVALLALSAAGVVVALRRPDRDAREQVAQTGPAVETAELVRQDMSTTDSLPGTLGYGAPRPVAGGGEGIVTWVPKPGATVRRGRQLYRVDDRPVPLFYGSMPLYRPLSTRNTAGRDVRIVANNLRALGYSIGHQPSPGDWVSKPQPAAPKGAGKADPPAKPAAPASTRVRSGESVLTASLIAAIKRWQHDAGMPETGALAPGDVVVQRGPVRVDSVSVQPGAAADGPLMSVTPTDKVITVLADANQGGAVDRGDKVTVSLPGDKTARATVSAVGTELKAQDGEAGDAPPRLSITVTLDDPKVARRIDSADVEVAFAGETHEDVLVAPVGALVALSEGGYAVQVEGGGLVAVETGMFAKGLVEIEGAGLEPGTRVVTTS